MSKIAPPQDNLREVFARIQTAAFITVVGGMLLLTLASTFGNEAIRTILLSVLTIVFIFAGGIFGLVTMQHIGQTHLPEEADEEDLAGDSGHSATMAARRARGFLGMFALQEPDPTSGGESTSSPDMRRTA